MTSFFRLIALTAAMLVGSAVAHAEEFRIGFINTDRVFKESNSAKQAQAKLEQEFSKRERELNEAGNALKNAIEKFEREAPTMAESQRNTRQRQLGEQDRDFQRKRREFQEELNARKNEELQVLQERAIRIIKQVAESEKYDLVIQDMVYINPKHDITDKVLRAINNAK
jgi:outer membrane protein